MPPGLECRTRESDSAIYTFLLNHNDEPVAVELDGERVDMFTGKPVSGKVIIGPRDLLLLREVKEGR
jgi:beta-galactosidase GanA